MVNATPEKLLAYLKIFVGQPEAPDNGDGLPKDEKMRHTEKLVGFYLLKILKFYLKAQLATLKAFIGETFVFFEIFAFLGDKIR